MTAQISSAGDVYNGQFRIPDSPPPGWLFETIVYVCYQFQFKDKDGTNPLQRLSFNVKKDICREYLATDFNRNAETFVQQAMAKSDNIPDGWSELKPKGYNADRHTLLDVPSYKPNTLVIIGLSTSQAWQFRRYDAGLTTKRDYGDTNGLLRHFSKTGKAVMGERPGDEGCHFLCFAMNKRAEGEIQHFNLHIELLVENSRPLEIMIDPDIPNDGGHLPGF
ncbi:hypothetical protein QO010_000681 [Caulobacter ginsengisoli]|uniref:RES domain-containing protein n=1 Tax=Caulobacter ginsengisoli TaxID=400775 RepID=A0ABU0ILP1_9CAUL|nr:nucleotide synthetase [Caulobacter ginsengisoli]MDQ0462933.1 hypothetical protein [Caulobacter ginsengisoli]